MGTAPDVAQAAHRARFLGSVELADDVPLVEDLAVGVRADVRDIDPDRSVVQRSRVPGALILVDQLVNLELFDEYRGEGIDSGRKSLALGLTLQDSSRTLKDNAVDAILDRVVGALSSELAAQLR